MQLYLFGDLKPPPPKQDSVILFHLSREAKDKLVAKTSMQGLSITRLLNDLIDIYIKPAETAGKQPVVKPSAKADKKEPAKTGRGNIDWLQVEKAKELLRKRKKEGVRTIEVAEYVKCSQARAARLLDLLSGGQDNESGADFLVYADDDAKPVRYYIFKDAELN